MTRASQVLRSSPAALGWKAETDSTAGCNCLLLASHVQGRVNVALGWERSSGVGISSAYLDKTIPQG